MDRQIVSDRGRYRLRLAVEREERSYAGLAPVANLASLLQALGGTMIARLAKWLASLPWSLAFILAGLTALFIFAFTGSTIMSLSERLGAAGIYFVVGSAVYGGIVALGRYALRR